VAPEPGTGDSFQTLAFGTFLYRSKCDCGGCIVLEGVSLRADLETCVR
jgi:hypothetical protein